MVTISVDGKTLKVEENANLLQACLDNDIYIPNLCYMDGMDEPPASCRLCFIELEGEKVPVTACTIRVVDGMKVRTDTEAVRKLQRSAFRLLLSVHHVDCRNCPANRHCILQNMAKFLKIGLKSKKLDLFLKELNIDQNHPCLNYYPNRCVLCGRCVYICGKKYGKSCLTFAKRGMDTIISFSNPTETANSFCTTCSACVDICPVKAIMLKTK